MHTYLHTCIRIHSDTQRVDARSCRARARPRPSARWNAFCACAHTFAYTYTRRGHSQPLQVRPLGRLRQRRELEIFRFPASHQCGRAERLWCSPKTAPVGRGRQQCERGAGRFSGGRRPATPPPPHPAPNSASERPARDAQFLQELALAEPRGERLHLRGGDAPAAHHARVRPRPPHNNGQMLGSNGPKPWKVATHDAHTPACT
jgi:hypothetical protein